MLSTASIVRLFFFNNAFKGEIGSCFRELSERLTNHVVQVMGKMLLIAYSKANSFHRATFILATSDRAGWQSARSHPWLERQEGLDKSAPSYGGKVQTHTCSEKSWLLEVRFPCRNGGTQAPVEMNHAILQEVRKSVDLLPEVPHLLSPTM